MNRILHWQVWRDWRVIQVGQDEQVNSRHQGDASEPAACALVAALGSSDDVQHSHRTEWLTKAGAEVWQCPKTAFSCTDRGWTDAHALQPGYGKKRSSPNHKKKSSLAGLLNGGSVCFSGHQLMQTLGPASLWCPRPSLESDSAASSRARQCPCFC